MFSGCFSEQTVPTPVIGLKVRHDLVLAAGRVADLKKMARREGGFFAGRGRCRRERRIDG
jgi:hypothetical protein